MINKVFTNRSIKSGDDDDNEYTDFSNQGVRMYNDVKPMNNVDAYLDEEIRGLGHYRNFLQYMRQMEEYDNLKVWLSSPGGYFNSAMEIIQTMQESKGNILVIATGENASAATMIALAAPQLIIKDNTTFMFHAASYGAGGKMDNVASKVMFSDKYLKDKLWLCYEGFLTQEEFDQMISGKDMYMASDEISARLDKRTEWQKAKGLLPDEYFAE